VGGGAEILVLSASEDINTDQVDLGVTVLTSLRGGHVDDFARVSLNADKSVLSESRALHGVGGRASVLDPVLHIFISRCLVVFAKFLPAFQPRKQDGIRNGTGQGLPRYYPLGNSKGSCTYLSKVVSASSAMLVFWNKYPVCTRGHSKREKKKKKSCAKKRRSKAALFLPCSQKDCWAPLAVVSAYHIAASHT
jgi:hypothetical protein